MIINKMKEQLTINTASQTCDQLIFAWRKSVVSCQLSVVKRFQKGFTLIETLVAIAILLIAVVGPISLIGDALHKLYYAKDQMIAINLAQEGIEVVRQRRDSDMLGTVGADIFSLPNPIYYTVDASSASLNISTAGQKPVYINGDFYAQSGGTATQFTRLITITSVGSGTTERKVTSTVEWKTGGQTGTITVSEYLFKWAI